MTSVLPARSCKSSTFCVTKVKCGTPVSMAAIARCPALGSAFRTNARRHSYQPHTKGGSRSNASSVASSAASNFSHNPVCLSRNVGIPLSADTPAPVKTTTRVAARRAWVVILSRMVTWLGYSIRKIEYSMAANPLLSAVRGRLNAHSGVVGMPMTGAPPVTGRYISPPSGIPMTGAPPVTGIIMRGPMF